MCISSSSSLLLGWPNGWMDQVTTSLLGWLGSLVVGALDLQLDGREFNSRPQRCRVTTLGKLFTPYASVGRSGLVAACGVRGREQLCLSQQLLRCTSLGSAPFLQCLC